VHRCGKLEQRLGVRLGIAGRAHHDALEPLDSHLDPRAHQVVEVGDDVDAAEVRRPVLEDLAQHARVGLVDHDGGRRALAQRPRHVAGAEPEDDERRLWRGASVVAVELIVGQRRAEDLAVEVDDRRAIGVEDDPALRRCVTHLAARRQGEGERREVVLEEAHAGKGSSVHDDPGRRLGDHRFGAGHGPPGLGVASAEGFAPAFAVPSTGGVLGARAALGPEAAASRL
jgi:hypothetical protein